MKLCLQHFFANYDTNHDNQIDFEEFLLLMRDLRENVGRDELEAIFKETDINNSGGIDIDEFVMMMIMYLRDYPVYMSPINKKSTKPSALGTPQSQASIPDDESEEEDLPEDLMHLTPEQQQTRIKTRAAWMLGFGTLLVLLFSDPTVEVFGELGNRTGICGFYISFVLAPLASNASEVIASFSYAGRKTRKSITIALSTLEGAATMNNTFCLSIFMAIIYFRNLQWTFTAETIGILFVECAVGILALKRVHRLLDGLVILSLYPLSLAIVYVLQQFVG